MLAPIELAQQDRQLPSRRGKVCPESPPVQQLTSCDEHPETLHYNNNTALHSTRGLHSSAKLVPWGHAYKAGRMQRQVGAGRTASASGWPIERKGALHGTHIAIRALGGLCDRMCSRLSGYMCRIHRSIRFRFSACRIAAVSSTIWQRVQLLLDDSVLGPDHPAPVLVQSSALGLQLCILDDVLPGLAGPLRHRRPSLHEAPPGAGVGACRQGLAPVGAPAHHVEHIHVLQTRAQHQNSRLKGRRYAIKLLSVG